MIEVMAVAQGDADAEAVDFVSAYAEVAAEVVAAIPSCDMGARVPACPSWSAYDLLCHLGNVHAWAATIVETGRSAPEQDDRPPSRRSRSVARWYAGKAEDLLQVLRAADPAEPCWTFSAGHHTQAFWPRRQTHETWVHLVDLHQSARRSTEIPACLAADAVAEVLEVFLARMYARGRPATISAPLVLHAEDTGDTWLVSPSIGRPRRGGRPRPGADGPPIVRRLSSPDAAVGGLDTVTASAPALMLLLWKRLSADDGHVHLDGDVERLRAFLASPLTP